MMSLESLRGKLEDLQRDAEEIAALKMDCDAAKLFRSQLVKMEFD